MILQTVRDVAVLIITMMPYISAMDLAREF